MWKFSGNFNNLPRHFLYFSSSCVHITRFDGENNVRINMTITLLYSDYSGLYLHWYTQTHVPVLQFSGQHLICLHLHLFSVSLLPPPSSFLMVCPPHQGSRGCSTPPPPRGDGKLYAVNKSFLFSAWGRNSLDIFLRQAARFKRISLYSLLLLEANYGVWRRLSFENTKWQFVIFFRSWVKTVECGGRNTTPALTRWVD